MSSSAWEKIQADVDALSAAVSRFQALSWEAMTPAELVDALERYALFVGRLDALIYELSSPFTRLGGTRP
ncbi:hypothetical protein DQP58_05765 [Mycobacterium colombiense]|uniref:Uncharacterized protein n=1 Tax=Mycobacterium colombiense TaxID=339268 RepID=A0A329KUV4_9MYCO|nr:hypothetical protein [Mycobacterium colombiense]RAU98402.1 hypothetical protein DQP58_05765 [Mycobacterium colombiense]